MKVFKDEISLRSGGVINNSPNEKNSEKYNILMQENANYLLFKNNAYICFVLEEKHSDFNLELAKITKFLQLFV